MQHVPDLVYDFSCVVGAFLGDEVHLFEEEVHLDVVEYERKPIFLDDSCHFSHYLVDAKLLVLAVVLFLVDVQVYSLA